MSRAPHIPREHIQRAMQRDDQRVPVSVLLETFGQSEQRSRAEFLLGPDGPLAQAIPGYQVRQPQLRMTRMVAEAIRLRKPALLECGTATGKSLGYLVPCIAAGGVTIVAVSTTALIRQLTLKDLPMLRQTLGIPFTFTALYGRGNYLCRAKQDEPLLGFSEREEQVTEWADSTETGLLLELPVDFSRPENRELRLSLISEEEDCPGKKCPHYEECWFYRARRRAAEAQVIVTTHALLAQALLLPQLLPAAAQIVIDEAHQFPGYMVNALEVVLTPGGISKLLRKAAKLGIQTDAAQGRVGDFFRLANREVRKRLKRDVQWVRLVPGGFQPEFMAAVDQLAGALSLVVDKLRELQSSGDARAHKAQPLVTRLEGVAGSLASLLRETKNYVLWAELSLNSEYPVLRSTPYTVSGFLRETLFGSGRPPVVMTSATLCTRRIQESSDLDRAFRWFRDQVGCENALMLQVESPFNYDEQLLYCIPEIDSEPSPVGRETQQQFAERWSAAIAPWIRRFVDATRGGAFVLFTSAAVLRETRKRFSSPYPLRCQGELGKDALVDWFKRTEGAVLFGLKTFWEGVDVSGRALRCVVIDRFPFVDTRHPVEAARQERIGKNSFNLDAIPRCTTDMKQGAGRVIRTITDRGLIGILDPRIRTRTYGQTILSALPGSPIVDMPGVLEPTVLDPQDLPYVYDWLNGAAA